MSTFLQLCQQYHQEIGAAGTITTVLDQTGMLKRYIDWIAKANRKIQGRKANWKFLWNTWELTFVTGISEYSPPDGLGSFDEDSFWVGAGTADAYKLDFVEYKYWRDVLRNEFIDSGEPSYLTIKPNGKVALLPTPDSDSNGLIVTADYWRAPVELSDNNQVSLIPPMFHDLIISLAKMYHAEYRHDSGVYAAASVEHETMYRDLKAHSLPGKEEDNRSESVFQKVIVVD